MEDLTGRQFGAYRIVAPLGEGGMAAVYRAYQASVDRPVALKVLPRSLAGDSQFQTRFQREARVVAQLQHPHILPVFDFGESDGFTYFAMPFVAAGTLSRLLDGNPVPLPRLLDIMRQVCDALDYAHSKGIIHRDIKPTNILIDERNNCLVADFGLAKLLESNSQLTTAGGMLGTPAYMAPEQAMGEPVTHRSDIYSLSIVLYEMMTGRVPYKAETPLAVAIKHAHGPLPMPRVFNAALPAALEQVVLRGLARNPDDRYATCMDMYHALETASRMFSDASIEEVTNSFPPTARPVPLEPPSRNGSAVRRAADQQPVVAAGAEATLAHPAAPAVHRSTPAVVPPLDRATVHRPSRSESVREAVDRPASAAAAPPSDVLLRQEPRPPSLPQRTSAQTTARLKYSGFAAAAAVALVIAVWWISRPTVPATTAAEPAKSEASAAAIPASSTAAPTPTGEQPAAPVSTPQTQPFDTPSGSPPNVAGTPAVETRIVTPSSNATSRPAVERPTTERPTEAPAITATVPKALPAATVPDATESESKSATSVTPEPATAPPSAPAAPSGRSGPPRRIKTVPPVYPPAALAAGIDGIVTLAAKVDPSGKVIDAQVLQSIPQLDAAAIAAVKQWEYEPTTRDEPVTLIVTVAFKAK